MKKIYKLLIVAALIVASVISYVPRLQASYSDYYDVEELLQGVFKGNDGSYILVMQEKTIGSVGNFNDHVLDINFVADIFGELHHITQNRTIQSMINAGELVLMTDLEVITSRLNLDPGDYVKFNLVAFILRGDGSLPPSEFAEGYYGQFDTNVQFRTSTSVKSLWETVLTFALDIDVNAYDRGIEKGTTDTVSYYENAVIPKLKADWELSIDNRYADQIRDLEEERDQIGNIEYRKGFDIGYAEGLDIELNTSFFVTIADTVSGVLSIPIFGSITLGTVAFFPLLVSLIFFILRMIGVKN